MAEKNGTINESVIEKVYGTSAGIDFNSPPQQRIMQLHLKVIVSSFLDQFKLIICFSFI